MLGRSGPAYAGRLDARRPEFRAQIKSAALDPFRGHANALRDSLSDAVQVLDAFHVVKLGTQVVDEVRRRLQQEQLGRRGHRDDPLCKIRGLLRHGLEHLTERLDAVGFFFPEGKRASMAANLANLFHRAPLTDADVRTLHGVVRALAVKQPGRKPQGDRSKT